MKKLRTLVLNANYRPRAIVPVARAFSLQFEDGRLAHGMGRITVVLSATDVLTDEIPEGMRVWRSPAATHPVPLVVALRRMESPLFDLHNVPLGRPSFRHLYRRDRGRCLYCLRSERELGIGGRLEIDHIVPRSRFDRPGDADSWENVALSCRECNAHKRDRTPEEAGMTLHGVPLEPNRWDVEKQDLLHCQRVFVDWMLEGGDVPTGVFDLRVA